MLTENEPAIIEAEEKDLRKTAFETVITEISIARCETAHAINHLKNWVKPTYPSKTLVQTMDGIYVKPEPYGVVLIIGAWNYPTLLLVAPLVGAIAAGNCAVLKTSEVAEHTAKVMTELIPKYLDKECFPVYNGAVPETTELLKQKFDYIFFTGNPMVGKIVMQAAAKHLTPVTLELGGKSPVYLHKKSDAKLAASRIAWGKLINLGQTCVAPDYIMCDSEIKEDFVKALCDVIIERFGKDPQKSKDLPRLINDRQFNRLKGLLDKTPKEKIVFGGQTDEADKYIAPTIVNNCTMEDALMSDELFGPIFPIMEVNGKEEAVATINKLEKPLALYVFSNEPQVVDYVLSNTSSGGVTVNDTILHMTGTNVPFGGVGTSGTGSYHGKYSFDTFSHHRTVCYRKQNLEALLQSRYPPYTDTNLSRNKFLIEEKPGAGSCCMQ
ncbi:aldehyde dehydrogenase family 3 member B1-like isoform X2 [Styela clava]